MYDVIVLGYGLVGNTAALLLGQQRIRTAVIERKALSDLPISKAGRVDAEVARIFKQLKLWDKLEANMHPLQGTQLVDKKGKVLFQVNKPSDTEAAPVYGFYQPDIQPILQRTVRRDYGRYVDVFAQTSFEAVETYEDRVEVFIKPKGDTSFQKLTAKYLLVCNGQHSNIPEAAGLTYQLYDKLRYTLNVDTFAPKPLQAAKFAETIYDAELPVTRITNNEKHQRWEFRLEPDEVETAAGSERIRELLKELSTQTLDIQSAFVHPFQSKILKQWHTGRIIIAGDAAHVMPPYLGMGLSAGIKDVYNLVWKLELLLDGVARPDLLHFYKGERAPNVQYLIQLNRGIKQLFNAGWLRWLRGLIPILPKWLLQRTLDTNTLVKYGVVGKGKHRGRFVPWVSLRRPDGRAVSVDQATGQHFAIIALGQDPVDAVGVWHIEYLARLRTGFFQLIPASETFKTTTRFSTPLHDHTGELEAWMRARKLCFLILRPDNILYDAVSSPKALAKTLNLMQKKLPLTATNTLFKLT